VLHPLVFHTT